MLSGLEWVGTPAFAVAAVEATVPIFLAVVAALLCERAGLVNLGIEGMMLAGACVGAAVAMRMGPGPGIALGVLAGLWLALLHSLATVQLGVDQIVSGLAVNLLAFGASGPLAAAAFGPGGRSPTLERLPAIVVPWFGGLSPLVPLALLLALAALLSLRFGVAGLHLDAAATAPLEAEGAGVDVERLRYGALIACGALAGLAGAALSVEFSGHYRPGIVQGRGFLALAVCLLVRRSVLAGLVSAAALGTLQVVPAFLPAGRAASLLAAAPWLLMLVAMAVAVRRPRPAAGVPDRWRAGVTL